MRQQVKSRQRRVEHRYFEIDGTGTAAITTGGSEGTLVDNNTGDYTITFTNPQQRAVCAVATSKTDALYCVVTALSATAVTVKTYNAAGVATDADFFLIVVLSDRAAV